MTDHATAFGFQVIGKRQDFIEGRSINRRVYGRLSIGKWKGVQHFDEIHRMQIFIRRDARADDSYAELMVWSQERAAWSRPPLIELPFDESPLNALYYIGGAEPPTVRWKDWRTKNTSDIDGILDVFNATEARLVAMAAELLQ